MKVRNGAVDVVKMWVTLDLQKRDDEGNPVVDDEGKPVMVHLNARWIKELSKAQALVKLCRAMGMRAGYDYDFTGHKMSSVKVQRLAYGVIRQRNEALAATGQMELVSSLP